MKWGYAASATEPFDLVLDATMFSEENEINVPWMRELHKLVPAAVLANIQSVVVLNPSNGMIEGRENTAMRIAGSLSCQIGQTVRAHTRLPSICMPRAHACHVSRVLYGAAFVRYVSKTLGPALGLQNLSPNVTTRCVVGISQIVSELLVDANQLHTQTIAKASTRATYAHAVAAGC